MDVKRFKELNKKRKETGICIYKKILSSNDAFLK